MKFKRLCILDTETTSVYWNSAAPLQIAAEICDENWNVIDRFEEKIKTMRPIPSEASAINHIYAKDLVNCRSEVEVLRDFIVWLKDNEVDCVLTYNGEVFDRPMLKKRCEYFNLPTDYFDKDKVQGIDGKDYVFQAKRDNLYGLKDALGRGWKLSKVAELLNIDATGAHDALVDVELLRQVYIKLDKHYHPENWNEGAAQVTTSLF